ncbi:MAG: amphi-Trp domain-containing protein [Desulfovibrio sp.]
MASDKKFMFESIQDNNSIRNFLDALVNGFESGRIVLSTDADEIVMNPCGLLNFEVKAKKKGGESKINIKVSWKEYGLEGGSPAKDIKVES